MVKLRDRAEMVLNADTPCKPFVPANALSSDEDGACCMDAMMISVEGPTVEDPEVRGKSEVSAGEAHDFARLFAEDGPGLWRAIYAFTGGRRAVADDVVAEAFARAIAHAGSIREPVPWLYRVSFRIAQAELKRERRSLPGQNDAAVDPPEVSGLMPAMRQLSPNQRAAVALHYEADLPVAEIGNRMGITSATVRVHLHRGRTRLRELLGAEDDES
jgi:RNA polymerase sigma-70 factor, ECF subfamily